MRPESETSSDLACFALCRSGVGRLVAACEAPPLVVPIVHAGMQAVMPRGRSLPVPGQKVRPASCFACLPLIKTRNAHQLG